MARGQRREPTKVPAPFNRPKKGNGNLSRNLEPKWLRSRWEGLSHILWENNPFMFQNQHIMGHFHDISMDISHDSSNKGS